MNNILKKMIDCYEAGDQENNELLNELLLEFPEERKRFLLEVVDEDLITDELKNLRDESFSSARNRIRLFYPTIAVASLIFATIGVISYMVPKENGIITETKNPENGVEPIARLLISTSDTEWNEPLTDDDALLAKRYELKSGIAHIEFSNGVELSMVAPASIEIKDSFNVILYDGKVRAYVPDSGYGFKVSTPDIDIRDLGTEFGLEVTNGIDTKVNVFSGEIELYTDSDSDPILANEGYAAKWVKGLSEKQPLSNESSYPTYKSIAHERWEKFQQELLKDTSLILSLDFKNGNTVIPSITDPYQVARASSHTKVRGRWYQKSAYVIESFEQGITLPDIKVDGDFTLQAWIFPDVFESRIRVIMNTEEYGIDRLHWQIERGGNVFSGPKVAKSEVSGKIKLGQWNQVTLTCDTEKKILTTYVNGEAFSSSRYKLSTINMANSMIGAWTSDQHRIRVLNGKIDEFLIFSRRLNKNEIARSYRLGRPQ